MGKSFLIGVLFAALSASVVYFGVGESLEAATSVEANAQEQNTGNQELKVEEGAISEFNKDIPVSKSTMKLTEPEASKESQSSSQENERPEITKPSAVKPDRVLLEEAKQAAQAGLYLDSADLIAEIKSSLMRDTARSNLALALARDGEKEYAMAVVEDVETEALAKIMRAQINQALSQ